MSNEYKDWTEENKKYLTECPQCGGAADRGIDNCIPASAYMCSKCCAQEDREKYFAEHSQEAKELLETVEKSIKQYYIFTHLAQKIRLFLKKENDNRS